MSAVLTDAGFTYRTHQLARATSLRAPTYAYEFTDADAPLTPRDPTLRIGAYHGAELQYLFNRPTTPLLDDGQRALSAEMMKYWTNFAVSGDPSRGADVAAWPRFDVVSTPYRNLNPSGEPPAFAWGAYQLQHHIPFWRAIDLPT